MWSCIDATKRSLKCLQKAIKSQTCPYVNKQYSQVRKFQSSLHFPLCDQPKLSFLESWKQLLWLFKTTINKLLSATQACEIYQNR